MSKRRRLASATFQEEKKTIAPPRRIFPPPPPPECVIVSQAELAKVAGSQYVLLEMELMHRDYAHLLNDQVNFVITQKPRTKEEDDCYGPVAVGGTSVTFEDKNGEKRHLSQWGHLATNIALIRFAGRQRYRKAVIQSLCVGLHSPNSSIHRAFNSALGEIKLFRCILDF